MIKFLYCLITFFCTGLSPLLAQTPPSQPPPTAAPIHHKSTQPFDDINLPGENNDDHFTYDMLNMLASLGIILVMILLITWFLKRFLNTRIQQMNDTSNIKIVERRALTTKTSIYLIEVNGAGYTVAESANGVTVLGNYEPTDTDNEASQKKKMANFGQLLQDKLDEGKS